MGITTVKEVMTYFVEVLQLAARAREKLAPIG